MCRHSATLTQRRNVMSTKKQKGSALMEYLREMLQASWKKTEEGYFLSVATQQVAGKPVKNDIVLVTLAEGKGKPGGFQFRVLIEQVGTTSVNGVEYGLWESEKVSLA